MSGIQTNDSQLHNEAELFHFLNFKYKLARSVTKSRFLIRGTLKWNRKSQDLKKLIQALTLEKITVKCMK